MNFDSTATYQDWTDALDSVLRDYPRLSTLPCPNCSVRALRIVFVGNADTHVGYCSFWCDNCGYGIRPSRVLIPGEADFFPFDTDPDVVVGAMPDFLEVYPDVDVDDEDEEESEAGDEPGSSTRPW